MGARLIAVPGWPFPFLWTASAARRRAVSTARLSSSVQDREFMSSSDPSLVCERALKLYRDGCMMWAVVCGGGRTSAGLSGYRRVECGLAYSSQAVGRPVLCAREGPERQPREAPNVDRGL